MADGLKTFKLSNIVITDTLFERYSKLVADKMIPYQWDILNDRVEGTMPTYCIENFKIAAGIKNGSRQGAIFQDTDLYKWIEAVAYNIESGRGTQFESIVDGVIDLIEKAQQEDGYLNTYITVMAPNKRWSNLVEGHELYTAGHLIEAAVAYYSATGKKRLLIVAQKFADLICTVFGTGEGQLRGYPGHQEIELALVKLYRITGVKRYLDCAHYFIRERGSEPNYFLMEIDKRGGYEYFHEFDDYDLKYSQSHTLVMEQESAEGHGVRAMYMYSAMADLALEYEDDQMAAVCQKLWNNITKKRMYITGSVGSSGLLERFTTDYDLPNDTNYSETCASIGLMMFGQRMNSLTKEAMYYDIVELALYNTVLAGMGITGERYFYVNPLEVVPEFCMDHTSKSHVKSVRQRWFHVACCPPNIARTLASLGQYIYAYDQDAIYINQFISSIVEATFRQTQVGIELKSSFIQDGKVKLHIKSDGLDNLKIKIRIPGYTKVLRSLLDGNELDYTMEKGYACFSEGLVGDVTIEIDFDVTPRIVSTNIKVRADGGKVALIKGPCVYCLEEVDNGKNLAAIYVSSKFKAQDEEPIELFGDVPTLSYEGIRLTNDGVTEDELYGEPHFQETKVKLRAIPYGFWNNRGEGEMLVWQKVRMI